MNQSSTIRTTTPPPQAIHWTARLGTRTGDLLPLFDFIALWVAGQLALLILATVAVSAGAMPGDRSTLSVLSWIASLIAPFLLYDQGFAERAIAADPANAILRHAQRLLVFVGMMAVVAYAGGWWPAMPAAWVGSWLAAMVCLTTGSRLLLARQLRAPTGADHVAGIVGSNPEEASTTSASTLIADWHPVTLLAERPIRRWDAVLKGTSDRILGALITLALLPVLAAVALAIRLDSPGPILFRQRRHGYSNSEFDIYKFRSMRVATAARGAALQQTVRGDDRVTRVGHFIRKWSLDELPQLFNVLQGHMSLVGPRPHAVNMRTNDCLGPEIIASYAHRHRVKPGITGWAQVNGARGATDTPEQLRRRIELDLHYVDHWSLLLDLKVLLQTFGAVLRPTNAF